MGNTSDTVLGKIGRWAGAGRGPAARGRRAWLAWLLALCCAPALALITGQWTVANSDNSGSGTNVVNGITTTVSGYLGANPSYGTETFNTTNNNYWNDPYGGTVAGGPSLLVRLPPNFKPGTVVTVNFDKPVDNPVMHVDRFGGGVQRSGEPWYANSSRWTLSGSSSQGGSVSLTRLSGNPQFVLSGNTFERYVADGKYQLTNSQSTGECAPGPRDGTACGSVRFNGTGISRLTFSVDPIGAATSNGQIVDNLEIGFSFPGSGVTVRKQSNGGTGSFPFTLGNLSGSNPTLNTASANPASSASFPVTDHGKPITLTEGAVAGFNLTSATCVDASGASVKSSLNSGNRQLTIASADYRTNQAITCTFTNDKQPILRLQKRLSNGRSASGDQFTLSVSGPGGTSATTTGSGSTANGVATVNPATGGSEYSFSESGASGANLANYTTTYACTNAYGNGTPGSNGNGTSFKLTPQAGDDITCTLTNERKRQADLAITKDDGKDTVARGQTTVYTIGVRNNGPDAVSGAKVMDPAVAELDCADPVPCSGGACPSANVPLADLQGGGVTLGELANGTSVTLTLSCRVK